MKLFEAKTIKSESNPKIRLTHHLQTISKGVDFLVLWLDCDREGENICFEVIENCLPNMKHGNMTNVLRAKFSGTNLSKYDLYLSISKITIAITKEDVRKAMNNLVKPNENESRGKQIHPRERIVNNLL